MARNSFIQISKLPNLKGRIDYITNPKRQENLYATYNTTDDTFWDELAKCNRLEFKKSGSSGKCIEGRELIIALPEAYCEFNKQRVLKSFTDFFQREYGVNCIAALHHNKTKTNLHIHLIFSEREELKDGIEKIATRNMFYDESRKHVRTKKEILDADGNIREGCSIIKKGEVYDYSRFSKKKPEFKSRSFFSEVKEKYTEKMNLLLSDDEKLKVFKNDGLYLPTKKIGKNNPKADEIAEANEARKEWNSLVDEALFYKVPAKHIKVIKYYKIIKASKRLSNVKTNLIDTNALPYSSFIKSAGRVFLDAVEKAIEFLKGLIEMFKAIIEPKKTHDEKTYKQYKKVYVVVSDLISERNNLYSKINYLENRLSSKDYKLIGGKKQLQGDIMSLEKECDRIEKKINKVVREVGEDNVDDVIRRFRDLERVKDAYESNLERQKEARMFLAENVKAYMETVKEDKVEAPEREKKYVRSR